MKKISPLILLLGIGLMAADLATPQPGRDGSRDCGDTAFAPAPVPAAERLWPPFAPSAARDAGARNPGPGALHRPLAGFGTLGLRPAVRLRRRGPLRIRREKRLGERRSRNRALPDTERLELQLLFDAHARMRCANSFPT